MTSSPEDANTLVLQKAPAIDRAGLLSGLAADLHNDSQQKRFTALILVELAGFRHLNRRFGFEVGDSVLAYVLNHLFENIKKASLVGRIGDDCFAIVVPELKSLSLLPVSANKIQQILAAPIVYQQEEIHLDSYVGISVAPLNAISNQQLLMHAEQSLQRARRAIDHCYMADAETEDSPPLNEWELQEALRRAAGANELMLCYQPKICLQTLTPVACEALMRWHSESFGEVSPGVFIPLAEESGLIMDLTEWAALALPREAIDFRYDEVPLNVALNVSPKDLVAGHLHATLESALNIWDMPSTNVTLEITEGTLMDNPQASFDLMQALKQQGFRLSIDDFGTGYSSMSYFKLIPADEIKIDKCFITNLANDCDDQVLVRAIIDLAHHFQMKTVAEGVEDMQTLQMLMAMKCDYAQGYHFTPALPSDQFKTWLSNYQVQDYFPQESQRSNQ